jgi:hypothetical protein
MKYAVLKHALAVVNSGGEVLITLTPIPTAIETTTLRVAQLKTNSSIPSLYHSL